MFCSMLRLWIRRSNQTMHQCNNYQTNVMNFVAQYAKNVTIKWCKNVAIIKQLRQFCCPGCNLKYVDKKERNLCVLLEGHAADNSSSAFNRISDCANCHYIKNLYCKENRSFDAYTFNIVPYCIVNLFSVGNKNSSDK